MRKWLLGQALGLLAIGPALAGDPMAGEVLAEAWCSSCHDITSENVASDAAPTFYYVMNVENRSADYLSGWLVNPHGAMPDPNLSRSEINNIAAYMGTLKVN